MEDTAEATIRVYQVLSQLPNEEQSPEDFQPQDFEDEEEFSEDELQELLQQLQSGEGQSDEGESEGEGEEGDDSYESPQEVEFRGDFKPELVQLLNRLRTDQMQQGEGDAEPITKEMLEELLKESAEFDMDDEAGKLQNAMGLTAQNLMKEAGVPPPSSQPGQGYGQMVHEDEQGGALEAVNPSLRSTMSGTSEQLITSPNGASSERKAWMRATSISITTPCATMRHSRQMCEDSLSWLFPRAFARYDGL